VRRPCGPTVVPSALTELIEGDDDAGVLDWFPRHYPRCMNLVLARRREQFIAGVRKTHEDDSITL
jgi:hypothetical protein